MEERQVTVDTHTYRLARPFMVIATQNPIELEGTYPLPEAQLDRFLMRIRVGYPSRDAELSILDTHGAVVKVGDVAPVASAEDVAAACDEVAAVHVSPALKGYIVDLVEATRTHRDLVLGVSPRGALALLRASRALAASESRDFVTPDDVKALAPAVLAHRLLLTADAQIRGVDAEEIVVALLGSVPVPGAGGR